MVCLLLVAPKPSVAQARPSAFLKNNEVYIRTLAALDARAVTDDGLAKSNLIESSSRQRFAFLRETKTAMADIVVMKGDGSIEREIHFHPVGAGVLEMRGVEKFAWISEHRLVVAGSINPSTCMYAVIDTETGQEAGEYLVDGFTWEASPDGEHAAYIGFMPHFMARDLRRPQLCLDGECGLDNARGYPNDGVHVEFTTRPEWSPDSTTVAIVAGKYETDLKKIIIRRLEGRTDDVPAPEEAEGSLGLKWDGATLILSASNGKWRFDPDAAKFIPARPTIK